MATMHDDGNPSGIVFDDPGPGAGLKAPGVPSKVAQVAAKAKTVPGVKGSAAAAAPAKVAAKLKKGTAQVKVVTAERYKLQDTVNATLAELGPGAHVAGIAASTAIQNAFEVVIEFSAA